VNGRAASETHCPLLLFNRVIAGQAELFVEVSPAGLVAVEDRFGVFGSFLSLYPCDNSDFVGFTNFGII